MWRDVLEFRYDNWRDMRITMVDRKNSSWWRDLCTICDADNHFIGLIVGLDSDHSRFTSKLKDLQC